MKKKIVNALQQFSKGMFVPILILPIAGIIIAIGNILTNSNLAKLLPFMKNPIVFGFGKMLSGSLVSILVNLGLIFCVGLAVGLAKEKKSHAGFTAVLAYLVFINAMNIFLSLTQRLVPVDKLRGSGQAMVMGVQILDMGVFLGIILGIIVAYFHNKYVNVEFEGAWQIYSGPRLVFMILIPVVVILAVILSYVWPPIQKGISSLGEFIRATGNFGIFIYGFLERILIPTGLHHLVYTPFLYSPLGGVAEIGGKIIEGSRNIYFAEMADPSILKLSKTVIYDARGLSKMFGLVGAAIAMYQTAHPDKKEKIKALLIPATATSIIAGVTEPIEFSFLFTAPLLFVIHSVLNGLGMVVLNIFDVRAIGPNGFIDFLLYNVPLGIQKTGWPMFILIGLLQAVVYYVIFRFLIIKLNLKTPGREEETQEVKLYMKKDYIEKTKSKSEANAEVAAKIVSALGGKENIKKVDNCYTRLRLIIDDTSKVDQAALNETGASGVIIKDKNVQVVYGLHVTKVRKMIDEYLGIRGE
ncbi:PTS transporter subunit EIIC [Fonticella tunisiensis]|uniref:PTS system IIB component (Glc family) /PTS system IIC component (Glc family) n=1 Tax=Fonticella tunisiensis TaxID=1096341 RepID=A0A4R7KW60_9CLOT|nr:PTS transporter subunit EIIC [Fonticella tunisiensis]TDT62855.1 PTS system IIB component (Glc family) /PTS system IIC component (Glc family) [Fonticella tunisiensis]